MSPADVLNARGKQDAGMKRGPVIGMLPEEHEVF